MAPGFFSKLFGSKGNAQGPLEPTLDYLPTLIEKNFSTRKGMLEDFCAKKMAEIKYVHAKCLAQTKAMGEKELEEKANARFNKAALTSKKQLENQMLKLLQKLDPKDRGKTIDDTKHYAGESYMLLFNEVNSLRKNIVYTSAYLKEEMKMLGESLQEMLDNLQAMNAEFEKEKELFEFEKAKERIGIILTKKRTLEERLGAKMVIEKELKAKEGELAAKSAEIEAIRSGAEMAGMKGLWEEKAKIAEQKQSLKTDVSNLLGTIDRPMQRFKALVDSGRWHVKEGQKEYLDNLATNPMLVLKGDPRASTLKQILAEVKKAIEEEKIELKDKEKEKRLAALDELIAFNFFENVFWKLNEIQKRQAEIEKELAANPAQKKMEEEEKKAKEMGREIAELGQKGEVADSEAAAIRQEMEKESAAVTEFAGKVLGRTVLLKDW